MATSNGPWQNRARIEWVYTVSGSGSSRTVSVQAYLKMDQYASQFHNGTKSWSGAWGSGSAAQYYGLNPNQRVLIVTGAPSIGLNDTARTVSFTATANHFHGTTSSTLSVTLPAKVPSTPTGLSITRISDSSHRLNWTRGSTYTAVVVQRRVNGGAWSQVGRPTGNAATYTDNTTSANNKYEYRVAGVSAGGQSGWSNIATVYTTPAAVGAVSAVKAGTGIEVTATGLPPHATAYEISGNGALLDSNVTSWPWVDLAPDPAVTHTYTVVAKRGSLKSAGRVSNTVQLLAAPLAPTGLSPNGGVAASDEDVLFEWVHNPVDTTAQTSYELRYRAPGGAWTTLTGTTAASRAVSLAGGSFEWQVRTKGQHVSFGPWSAIATVGVVTRPGVAVQGAGSWDSPIYRVVWTFLQAQGRPQSAWQAELLDSEGARVSGGFVEGTGAATAVTFPARLTDGSTYTVRVRAATGSVWSAWAPLVFTVRFVLPGPVTMTGGWEERSGTVELALTDGRGPTRADVVNLFTNPNLVGDGTWAEVRRNYVTNPQLATSDSGWTSNAPAVSTKERVTDTGYGVFGSGYAYRVESATGGDGNVFCGANTPVVEGEVWTATVYTYAGYTGDVVPRFSWTGGFSLEGPPAPLGSARTYAPVRLTVTIPPGVSVIRFAPRFPNMPAGGAVRVRGVVLERGSGTLGNFFDGSTMDGTMVQPEDFRVRWLGTANASESVMEIERVRGLTATNCIAGVSTKDGKPSVRLISLRLGSGGHATATFLIPEVARDGGTFVGTSIIDETVTGNTSPSAGSLNVYNPDQSEAGAPRLTAGIYPQRLVFGSLESSYRARLYHGGDAGSPDVWWTDIGLFAGVYDGPVFAGDTGIVYIDGSAMSTSWEDEPNNSPSRATMAVLPDEVTVERSVEDGVWELVDEFPFTGEDALTDRESLSNGVTQYRVTATVSATGAASVTLHDVVADSHAIWLSGGEGFTETARLPYNPAVQISAGRQRTAKRYSGRPLPVIYSGEAVERAVQFGGSILVGDTDVAGLDTLERIAQAEYPLHQYRDPDGRRIFGMLGPISTTREAFSYWSYSASLEESER